MAALGAPAPAIHALIAFALVGAPTLHAASAAPSNRASAAKVVN